MNDIEKLQELRNKLEILKSKENNLNDVLLEASRDGSMGTHHNELFDDLRKIVLEEEQIQKEIDTLSNKSVVK